MSDFQNPQKIDVWVTLKGHLKVKKVKTERGVVTVASRPKVPIDNNVHCCPLSNSAS